MQRAVLRGGSLFVAVKRFGLVCAFASPGAFLLERLDDWVTQIRDICACRRAGHFALPVGLLACGGQALSLRGARPFQREERRWGVKQQVRSVSHDTARLNPAASSPGSSMMPPSCRTLVRYTENCPLNLAGLGRFRLPGSRWNDRETLRRWRAAVSSILRRWEFSQVIAGLRVVCASVSGRLMHLLLAPVTFPHVGIFPRRFAEFLIGSNH